MVKPLWTIGANEDARLIREEVFMKEQGFQNEFDEDDKRLWEFVLYLDDVPISTCRIKPIDPETFKIERVAVRKAYRGQKVGSYTVKFATNKIISLGGRKAVIYSQADKTEFYYKLGFRLNEEVEPFLDEGVPHVEMRKFLLKKHAKRR